MVVQDAGIITNGDILEKNVISYMGDLHTMSMLHNQSLNQLLLIIIQRFQQDSLNQFLSQLLSLELIMKNTFCTRR